MTIHISSLLNPMKQFWGFFLNTSIYNQIAISISAIVLTFSASGLAYVISPFNSPGVKSTPDYVESDREQDAGSDNVSNGNDAPSPFFDNEKVSDNVLASPGEDIAEDSPIGSDGSTTNNPNNNGSSGSGNSGNGSSNNGGNNDGGEDPGGGGEDPGGGGEDPGGGGDPDPVDDGYPTSANTGPRSTPNKTYNNEFGKNYGTDGYNIDQPNVTLEGYIFNRCVVVTAANVTIRDSKITCDHSIAAMWSLSTSGTTFEYNEIIGATRDNPSAAGVVCSNNCTAKRNRITATADGIKAGSDSQILENYIGQLQGGNTGSSPTHNDGIQIENTVDNVLLRKNTIEHDCSAQGSGDCNTAIFIQNTVTNVTIDNNYLKKWNSFFVIRANGGTVSGIKVINNYFQSDGVSGGKIAFTSGATASLVACNTQSSGATITDAGNNNSSCPAS